jgi:hypothetical protein
MFPYTMLCFLILIFKQGDLEHRMFHYIAIFLFYFQAF